MDDYRLGHAAAAREDFGEPEAWDYVPRWPLGAPTRAQDWNECEATPYRPRHVHVTAASAQCMTRGDVVGLQRAEEPEPVDLELADPPAHVRPVYTKPEVRTLDRCSAAMAVCGVHDKVPAVEPRTISEAAMWPFASSGWRNGDGGLGKQQERVRLEKLKAAEHQRWLDHEEQRKQKLKAAEHKRWLDHEEQRKRDAITACYSDEKVPA